MPDLASPHDRAGIAGLMRTVARETLAAAPGVHMMFVTNIHEGEVADLGPDGLLNTAQYYTRRQANEIIGSFQGLGVTVEAFFSEVEFITALVRTDETDNGRQKVVYTTAEAGQGAGRRALIPALCNLLDVPVLNSGPHACSLARHKFHANAVLRRMGVRAPETWQFGGERWAGDLQPLEGARVIVKPTYESMSIGVGEDSVQIVGDDFEEFVRQKHRRFDQAVLVQEFVSGEEVAVPIVRLGTSYALPAIAFRRRNGDLFGRLPRTFRDEVLELDLSLIPFEAEGPQYSALQRQAIRAFDALEMSGIGRIDLRVDEDGRAWVFDTNTSPPPIGGTSFAMAMESLGFSVDEMRAVWLGTCLAEYGLL